MKQEQKGDSLADYPLLANWAGLDPASFRKELDALAASGRGLAGKPAAQRAVQEAVKVLNDLYRSAQR
jgi:hypothetical protein